MSIMKTISEVAEHLNVLDGVITFAIAKNELTLVEDKIDLILAGIWIINHKKLSPNLVWRRNFVKSFTPTEHMKIVQNPQGIIWWLMLMDSDRFNINSLEIIGDVQGLVAANCITQDRALQILAI